MTTSSTFLTDAAQLSRIDLTLAKHLHQLAKAPQLSHFLRYVVEETLAGLDEQIKQYNVKASLQA